jgi:DUF971 family protein
VTDPDQSKRPVEIKLHQGSRILELAYEDGRHFELPCEYLRVYSPSAEVRGLGELQVYKEGVNITNIAPMGNYAVRIFFDDGHKSGVYSWEYLYDLGQNQEQYWNDYLQRLAKAGYKRRAKVHDAD